MGLDGRRLVRPNGFVGIDGRRLVRPNGFVGIDGRQMVWQLVVQLWKPAAHRAPRTHLAHRLEGSRAMAPVWTEGTIRPRTVGRYLLVLLWDRAQARRVRRIHRGHKIS